MCSLCSCGNIASMIWYHNGNSTPTNNSALRTLMISNLDASMAGVYECAAMLMNGSLLPREWVANLTVESKCIKTEIVNMSSG